MTDKLSEVARAIEKIDRIDFNANYLLHAKAAIEAYEKALEEQGLVIVPREPTDSMRVAALRATHDEKVGDRVYCLDVPIIWQAMIAAALEGKE